MILLITNNSDHINNFCSFEYFAIATVLSRKVLIVFYPESKGFK